jgi:hypothetical protein
VQWRQRRETVDLVDHVVVDQGRLGELRATVDHPVADRVDAIEPPRKLGYRIRLAVPLLVHRLVEDPVVRADQLQLDARRACVDDQHFHLVIEPAPLPTVKDGQTSPVLRGECHGPTRHAGTRKLVEIAGFGRAADTDVVSGRFPRVVMRLDLR